MPEIFLPKYSRSVRSFFGNEGFMAQSVRSARQEQLERLWEKAAAMAEGEDAVVFRTRILPGNGALLSRVEQIWRRAREALIEQSREHLLRVRTHLDLQREALAYWQTKREQLAEAEPESSSSTRGRRPSNPLITYGVCDQYIQQYTASSAHAEEILRLSQGTIAVLESLPSVPFEERKM